MDLIVDFPRASSQNEKRRPNERRVSFEEGGIEINFIENLSNKHKDELWYSQHEMNSFKKRELTKSFKRRAPLLRRAANTNIIVLLKCLHEADAAAQHADLSPAPTPREIRQEIRRAVFSEQQRQLRAGIYDPHEMANVSEAASDLSRKQARIISLLVHNADDERHDKASTAKNHYYC